MMTEGQVLGQPSSFCKYARLIAWAPWPMANREILLRGYGDVYDGNSVTIFSTDAEPGTTPDLNVNIPTVDPYNSHVNVHVAGFHFAPVDEETVLVRCMFNLDPNIALLPDFLLNIVVNKFCGVLLNLLRFHGSANKMKGSEYEKRQAESSSSSASGVEKDVYKKIRVRLAENISRETVAENLERYATEKQKKMYKEDVRKKEAVEAAKEAVEAAEAVEEAVEAVDLTQEGETKNQ